MALKRWLADSGVVPLFGGKVGSRDRVLWTRSMARSSCACSLQEPLPSLCRMSVYAIHGPPPLHGEATTRMLWTFPEGAALGQERRDNGPDALDALHGTLLVCMLLAGASAEPLPDVGLCHPRPASTGPGGRLMMESSSHTPSSSPPPEDRHRDRHRFCHRHVHHHRLRDRDRH